MLYLGNDVGYGALALKALFLCPISLALLSLFLEASSFPDYGHFGAAACGEVTGFWREEGKGVERTRMGRNTSWILDGHCDSNFDYGVN